MPYVSHALGRLLHARATSLVPQDGNRSTLSDETDEILEREPSLGSPGSERVRSSLEQHHPDLLSQVVDFEPSGVLAETTACPRQNPCSTRANDGRQRSDELASGLPLASAGTFDERALPLHFIDRHPRKQSSRHFPS